MIEREIRSEKDLVDWIHEVIDIKNMKMRKIEAESGKSQGSISRWKKFSPNLNSVLKVLSILDAKMVLRAYESEEEQAESEIEKTEEVETMDTEHGETEISEFDMLILDSAKKALKNCNSLPEKERLYKILQAFL